MNTLTTYTDDVAVVGDGSDSWHACELHATPAEWADRSLGGETDCYPVCDDCPQEGYLFVRQFMGYTKREATRLFRAELKAA